MQPRDGRTAINENGSGFQLKKKKKPMTTVSRSKETYSQKVFCLGKNVNKSG